MNQWQKVQKIKFYWVAIHIVLVGQIMVWKAMFWKWNIEECEVCKRAIENEVNLLNSESTASNKGSYEQGPSSFSPKAYEMEGSCSSKINNTKNENNLMTNSSNKDKFLDSYTTSWQPWDLMWNYPLHIKNRMKRKNRKVSCAVRERKGIANLSTE